MEIKKELNGTALTLFLSGRLDAVTAPDLDKVVQNDLTGITDLTLDFSELVYVASAGLRVLLLAQKRMKKQGSMKLTHVSEDVKDVLDMTGFIDFLTIEE
ncbi:MAG: STAS domain-containing protein [Selenomonas sp.]|jgi:anti-sigma B factor antagonist|uniref:STAS domain-containing protein n=1 Tax=Selenomonas sp. AE3005 TaxID=1485543 RepID=UPI000482F5D2|nr:STAS domain-containing protein [Selenomonas sp. AE3005]MBQ1416652.1 STAS domain-containing protein [Selenomonas sp.]MBQ1460439.1 STAS domain-containing protein [Selenomonas sp.]MBQ2088381.1 STAS domain-containing protein [Selenomonas sp.]MBQ2137623.1 STAS domain-containing protein [Selenomonas sp.]MBQ4212467.1 STAS domain-containing protein [Selenomonas sp.]